MAAVRWAARAPAPDAEAAFRSEAMYAAYASAVARSLAGEARSPPYTAPPTPPVIAVALGATPTARPAPRMSARLESHSAPPMVNLIMVTPPVEMRGTPQ